MALPPLHSSSRLGVCTCGDVVLQQGIALAPGVVLVADPGSLLVIETGVCIGKEAVLHATGGELRIEAGTILGAGVLVVGKGKIGPRATVGTCATLLEPAVAEGSVIAPGEIVGGFGEPQPVALAPAAVVSGGLPLPTLPAPLEVVSVSSPPLPLASGPPIQLLGLTAPVAAPLPAPSALPVGVAGGSSPLLPLASGPPIQDLPGPLAHTIALPKDLPEPEVQVATPPQDLPGPMVHVVTGPAHSNGAEGSPIATGKTGSGGLPPPTLLALPVEVSVGGSPPLPLASGPPIQGLPGPLAHAIALPKDLPEPEVQVVTPPQDSPEPEVQVVTPPQDLPEPEVQVATPPQDSPGPTAHVVTGMAHFARLKVLLMGNNGR